MDDVFGEIMGLGYGSDSIMLRLLRSEMDEAHENVQSRDGSIELLNARSKFYEMAMVLVEGCSELIEKKEQIPEINREKMLSDLKESRDMVRGRLDEIKFSIFDKDIEIGERIENEIRLRRKLEAKENELVSLRAKLELEKTKGEEFFEQKEGDFCDLKNSVDQQMLSIKQKLEDERLSLSSANDLFGDESLEEGPIQGEQNLVIEQMSSDIDCLKGTLDLAFGRMQNVEIAPLEKQWRSIIEKETILIAISGFISYHPEIIEVKYNEKLQNQIAFCFSDEQWLEFMREVTSLHNELKDFTNDVNEAQENSEFSKVSRSNSEPLPNNLENSNEDQDSEAKTYVAKLIKSHESIIRKQREELNWIKIRDIFQRKEGFSSKKNNDPDNLGGKIKDIIARLDYFIKWNDKIRLQKCAREKIYGDEIKKLKQERDGLSMQSMLIEDIYVTLIKGLINDLYQNFQSYEIENLIRDEINFCVFREMLNEWILLFVDEKIESELKEGVYMVVFGNFLNEVDLEFDFNNFENSISEEIYNIVLLEATKSGTELLTEVEAHYSSPSKNSVCEEENLIHEPDSPENYLKNQEKKNLIHELNSPENHFENQEDENLIHKPDSPEKRFVNQEEENLIHKPDSARLIYKLDFSEKCIGNQEELFLDDELSPRNYDSKQPISQINLCSIIVPLTEFESRVGGFESLVHQSLESKFLRLEDLIRKTQDLFPSVSSIRKGESLYKRAFEIRCHNLRLAETEVDLLGDQVEELVGLLETINLVLDKKSKTTSFDVWVSGVRNLIKKELERCRQSERIS